MELIDRPCPICLETFNSKVVFHQNLNSQLVSETSFSSRKLPEFMHYQLLWCSACDLLYASPAPSEKWLADSYKEAAFDSTLEAGLASKTYISHLRPFYEKPLDKNLALDIGTGEGSFLKELLNLGFTKVVGVEPSKAPIENATVDIRDKIRLESFNENNFEPCSFDLISCFQTLEHLYSPLNFVQAAFRLLKPDGKLFIVVHNRNSFVNKLLGKKSPIFDIEHLQLFSPKSVRLLFTSAGFEVNSCRAIVNVYPFSYWLKLAPIPNNLKRMIAAKFSKILNFKIPMPVGNLAVVGTKSASKV